MDRISISQHIGHRQQSTGTVNPRHGLSGGVVRWLGAALAGALLLGGCGGSDSAAPATPPADPLDQQLAAALARQGFTGSVEQKLESRLGRPLDPKLADLGRELFFDRITSLHNDSSCATCHSPTNGWGDTQSIAIGVESNLLVGPHRKGPRNLRRAPSAANTAFYPNLMWDGRFFAPSGDPFDNSQGFTFPPPEGTTQFRPNDPAIRHLVVAQAYIPTTQFDEMAGFTGIGDGFFGPLGAQLDDGQGEALPAPDALGSRNGPIRDRIAWRLNAIPAYVDRFGKVFSEVRSGAPIDYSMFARAVGEFEFTLRGANAPIDRFARGEVNAMTAKEKRGALLFFGKGNCVACHAVSGGSSEMFSDFRMHNIGVPQIAPLFGAGSGAVPFAGPGGDEDYGAGFGSGQPADRHKFRTSPLRNVALQPAFFHNGAYTRLDDAIRHHLDVLTALRNYDAKRAGVAPDLSTRTAPIDQLTANLDPLVRNPLALDAQELADLVQFVSTGLLDERMLPKNACALVPKSLPSGMKPETFEACQ